MTQEFLFAALLMMLVLGGVIVVLARTGRLAATPQLVIVQQELSALRMDNSGLHHTIQLLGSQSATLAQRVEKVETELALVKVERDLLARRNALLESMFEARGVFAAVQTANEKLRAVMADSFSLAELQQLCFDMGVDWESIEGEGKENRAQSLLQHFTRRNDLPLLLAEVRKRRPNARL